MHQNKIICLEGISGAGKSLQISKLNSILPNSGVIPEFIQHKIFRDKLRTTKNLDELISAMNLAQEEYYYKIKDREFILMDRGVYTLFALGGLRDLIPQLTVKPSFYFILDCLVGSALERIKKREIEKGSDLLTAQYKNKEALHIARENYRKMSYFPNTYIFDSENRPEMITQEILRLIK